MPTEQPSLQVSIWGKARNGNVGHVAIDISDQNGKSHISFVPMNEPILELNRHSFTAFIENVGRTQSRFVIETEDEMLAAQDPEYESYKLNNFNIEAMFRECVKITGHRYITINTQTISNFDWGLANYTCASIVMRLLKAGGCKTFLPEYRKFGKILHLFLLSFRVAAIIASISPIYYSIMMEKYKNPLGWLFPCLAYGINTVIMSILEFKLAYQNTLPWLKLTRQKKLFEFDSTNAWTAIVSSLTLGTGGCSINLMPYFFPNIGLARYLLDAGSIVAGITSFIIFGKITKKVIAIWMGMKVLILPTGIRHIVRYLTNNSIIPRETKDCLLNREISQIAIYITTFLSTHIARDLLPGSIIGCLIGTTMGLGIGYLITKAIMFKLSKSISNIPNSTEDQKLNSIIDESEPEPFKLAFLAACAIWGLAGSIIILENFLGISSPVTSSAISVIGSLLSLFFGLILYKFLDTTTTWSCTKLSNCYAYFQRNPQIKLKIENLDQSGMNNALISETGETLTQSDPNVGSSLQLTL